MSIRFLSPGGPGMTSLPLAAQGPKYRFVLVAWALIHCAALDSELGAQTLETLHSFGPTLGSNNGAPINSDGANPLGNLVLSGNVLYGTTVSGGPSGVGTVFRMNTDGSGFTTLHNFSGGDGASPQAELVLSGGTLYGTTTFQGSGGWGSIFALNLDGTGFTNLYSFTGEDDGGYPYSSRARRHECRDESHLRPPAVFPADSVTFGRAISRPSTVSKASFAGQENRKTRSQTADRR